MTEKFRKTWKKVDGTWEDIEFENLRRGDVFKIDMGDCYIEGRAGSDPIPAKGDGNWVFDVVEPFTRIPK